MMNIARKIQDLSPALKEILRVSGAVGVSLGVSYNGEVFTAGYGYRDIINKLVPDENTIYHIASLSKSFTAAGIGILVHEKKLAWDQKISQILPDFKHPNHEVSTESTILDFLSHRSGLATKNALWQQDGPELLLEFKDVMSTVSYLEVIEPLRSKWIYNNWYYDVGAKVIEAVSGISYGSFLSEKILTPLGLNDTFTALHPPEENWAHGYMPGPDGELTDVGRPVVSDGTVMQGAVGIKTTAKDLLKYYQAVLDAWKLETQSTKYRPSSDLPLKNVRNLLTEHIPLDPDPEFGQWYGAGWAIADLPAPLGSIGTNGMYVPKMPVVGKGTKTRVWYHNGSLVGFFSSVHILPETGTIIVVLLNSIPKNDCADWLGQLLVEALLDNPDKNDYLHLAKESANSYDTMWTKLEEHFQKPGPSILASRSLTEYAGKYFNAPKNWFIEVVEKKGSLQFAFQGLSTQTHQLHPYGDDVFAWPLKEEDSRHVGRWPDLDVPTYLFNFGVDETERIKTLRWVHDPDVPDGETFVKLKASGSRDEL